MPADANTPSPHRIPRDLDAEVRAVAVRLTGEAGEVITPGRVLALAARRGLATVTADDMRRTRRTSPRAA